jgi:hypothetical protein
MTNDEQKVSPLWVMVAFATVYLVWGSTYFFIQKAITDFPPFLMGADGRLAFSCCRHSDDWLVLV